MRLYQTGVMPVPGIDEVEGVLQEVVELGYGSENASALIKVVAAHAGADLMDARARL